MRTASANAAAETSSLVADMRKTKKLVLSSVCAALGVICLYLGGIIEVLDMTAAVAASLLVLFAVLEIGYGYAAAVYAMISLLGFLLLPNKSPAIFFLLMFGYVPMTKFFFEKHLGKLSWAAKLTLYNALLLFLTFFAAELVGFSTENEWGIAAEVMMGVYVALANVVYVACDILYKRLSILYLKKFREKIHKLLK